MRVVAFGYRARSAHAGARGVPRAPAHGSRRPTRRPDARSRGGPPSPYPPAHPQSWPGAGLIPPSQFAHASLERDFFTSPTRSEGRTNDRGGHFYLTVRRTFSLNSDSTPPRVAASPRVSRRRWRNTKLPGGVAGRVEDERGGVQDRRRLLRAASFVVALAEKSIAPFLLPAHRTGRDHFGHPALGRVSRAAFAAASRGSRSRARTPSSPNTAATGNCRYPGPASLCRRRRKRRTE